MRRSSSVKEDRRRPRFSSFAARLMPPAAGLRPNPTPLRDQGKDTRGGDLLAARHEGNQTGRWVARRESVPCHPPPGPAGTSPRREEITTQPEARARKDARGRLRRIRAEVRDDHVRGSGNAQFSGRQEPSSSFPLKGSQCGFEPHRGHRHAHPSARL